MSDEGQRLDPKDWDGFGAQMHDLLDRCLARMRNARDLPWQPVPPEFAQATEFRELAAGQGAAKVFDRLTGTIMPQATGNTHPRFFGWVHGTGLPVAMGAELVASAMNSNCGGRDHGAAQVETTVIRWLCGLAGLPGTGFGLLTTGTSQATILALAAARTRRFGGAIRKAGIGGLPPVSVHVAQGAHSCIGKALELLGHGSDSLRVTPTDTRGRMDMVALQRGLQRDRDEGRVTLAVVGTAGSVNTGSFDDLAALGALCRAQDIWFHVDGAFGFWTLLADAPWRDLPRGIELADSVATDLHKWIGVPYDCGACLMRDGATLRDTFSERPDYLAAGGALAGGELWFCDYGTELSRGFRALKVWASLQAIGTDAFGAAISDNCRQAALMGELVEAAPELALARPVISNLCTFRVEGASARQVAARLQLSGEVVFSTTRIDGEECLRAAIVNHRTTSDDIHAAIEAVRAEIR